MPTQVCKSGGLPLTSGEKNFKLFQTSLREPIYIGVGYFFESHDEIPSGKRNGTRLRVRKLNLRDWYATLFCIFLTIKYSALLLTPLAKNIISGRPIRISEWNFFIFEHIIV